MTRKNRETEVPQKAQRNRRALFDVLQSIAQKTEDERKQYSRQIDYDDAFSSMMTEGAIGGIRLVPPPYLPGKMYELYEQSGILKTCVEAYVDNVDGYGYSIASSVAEDDNLQKESNPAVSTLKEFFDCPNDKESFTTIRNKVRRDCEVTGNGYIEVVRGRDTKPVLLFWADAKRMRITTAREPVRCTVKVPRGGSLIDIQAEKRFRTYCMLSGDGAASGPRTRFFKEYGDPRQLDATTGQFAAEGVEVPDEKLASEVLHFKHGNDVYGIPRWIGTLLSVMGAWKANLVNFDLFDNQGIPPLIISIAGGSLTDASYQDLLAMLKKAKGARNFHKLLVLEAESIGTSVDGKDAVPKLDIKNMAEFRKEDAMFLQYLERCDTEVQKLGFRLPGMFLGISDDANFATAFIVRNTAEEQIFQPERERFDEIINQTLIRDLVEYGTDLRFRSNGPSLQSVEDLPQILSLLVQSGVFTVNGLISFVNTQFGLKIALYEGVGQEWADEPMAKISLQEERPGDLVEGSEADVLEAVRKNQKIYAALKEIEQVAKKFSLPQKGCGCAA